LGDQSEFPTRDSRSIDEIAAEILKQSVYLGSWDQVTLFAILLELNYDYRTISQLLDTRIYKRPQVEQEMIRVRDIMTSRAAFIQLLHSLENKIPKNQQEDEVFFETPINRGKQPPLYRMKMPGHRTFHGKRAHQRKRS
jgi:hypothetical protein